MSESADAPAKVRMTLDQAFAWANDEGVYVPNKRPMDTINAARRKAGEPEIEILLDSQAIPKALERAGLPVPPRRLPSAPAVTRRPATQAPPTASDRGRALIKEAEEIVAGGQRAALAAKSAPTTLPPLPSEAPAPIAAAVEIAVPRPPASPLDCREVPSTSDATAASGEPSPEVPSEDRTVIDWNWLLPMTKVEMRAFTSADLLAWAVPEAEPDTKTKLRTILFGELTDLTANCGNRDPIGRAHAVAAIAEQIVAVEALAGSSAVTAPGAGAMDRAARAVSKSAECTECFGKPDPCDACRRDARAAVLAWQGDGL